MKKTISILLVIICFMVFSFHSFADSSKIEISFKVGDEVLKINGKDVQVQKPYVVDGVTLVPLRVITEAFGAEVIWNGDEKSITLKYAGKIIKLVIDSLTVQVDGNEASLEVAPAIENGVTMVPLRFVTENFGADVKYDEKTKSITVTKEVAGDKSIKDFSALLKSTTKSKVGDSYYQWSMNLPKGVKISDRNFDGSETTFSAEDDSYEVELSIWTLSDETLDTLMTEEIKENDDLTLVSKKIEKKNGVDCAWIVWKGKKSVYDVRYFIKGKYVYMLIFSADEYSKYIDSSSYTSLLNSFTLDFSSSGEVEDISDVVNGNYRIFDEKNLKFSINVPAIWYHIKNTTQQNKVRFANYSEGDQEYYDGLYIDMYSKETDFSLDGWIKKQYKSLDEEMNKDYYKIIKEESGNIGGKECKKLYYTQKIFGRTIYSCDVIIAGDKYKYNVYYHIKEETYNNKEKLAKYEDAINSFKFTEPDAAKVGELTNSRDAANTDSKFKKSNTEYKWSFEIPATWTVGSNNNDKDSVSYHRELKYFQMQIIKNIQLENFISYLDEELAKKVKLGTIKNLNKTKISAKGTDAYYYTEIIVSNNVEMVQYYYVISKNGYLYTISFTCPIEELSEYNKNVFDAIWQSLKI